MLLNRTTGTKVARQNLQIVKPRSEDSSRVPVSAFGEDHWRLLAYIDTCCLNFSGRVEHGRMRCKPTRHKASKLMSIVALGPQSNSGTRLKGFCPEKHPEFQLPDHDDWDCLKDLEAAGFADLVCYATGLVHITPAGLKLAAALREHGAQGKSTATFVFKPVKAATSV